MAYKLTLATALLASLAAAAPAQTTTSGGQEKIVGGEAASEGEFPYIVSLSQYGSHFCGGALLNAETVVTAGHCSEGMDAGSVQVRAGTLVSTP